MSVVAVCTAGGTVASTTTSVLLAATVPKGRASLVAECDSTGGDVAAWSQLPVSPGWATAVAEGDRSWSAVMRHAQALPSGLRVMTTPARAIEARTAVVEASKGFADLLASMPDVVTVADCGRVVFEPPVWAVKAKLTLLLMRQSTASAQATAALVDRTLEALDVLRAGCRNVGVVLIGGAPYSAREVAEALGVPLFGALPEDRAGASLAAGGWTIGRRAARSPLGRAAAGLAERVIEALYGRVVVDGWVGVR